MRSKVFLTVIAVFLGSFVDADFCAEGKYEIDGNWFCQPVTAITYSNVGTPGSYLEVIEMASNGICASTPKAFGGPIAPLDEEVSFHFRGPVELKQFAAYAPFVPTSKKRESPPVQVRDRGHHHQDFHNRVNANNRISNKNKRQEVTATIDGQVVSWENNWFGETATPSATVSLLSAQWVTATVDGQIVSWFNTWVGDSATAPMPSASLVPSVQMVTATLNGQVVSWFNNWFGKAATSTSTVGAVPDADGPIQVENTAIPQMPTPTSDVLATTSSVPKIDNSTVYERIGYYNSASQVLDNLVFLGNYGGQGSGVFDENFGASLAYASCDGTGGASSPQILADVTIPSDFEVIVMTAQECTGDSCGYFRPGSVAYHGFGGADKVFMIEFAMPMDGKSGFNGDMPAIWALNAKIPRTLQYGNISCSCWESGCGEFDIVEALDDGSTFLKSTLHTNTPGGDSDYIDRPTSATMKLAVVFSSSSSTIHIQVLPDSTDFSSSITAGEIEGMCENISSLFDIS